MDLRDFLSNLPITTGLAVNDTSGWLESGLSSATPILHYTPYGSWRATWTHTDYGDSTKTYTADGDYNYTLFLESKVVHVWEARTDYVFDPTYDKIAFKTVPAQGWFDGRRQE